MFDALEELKRNGWTINVFSREGHWLLNARHVNSYTWESYECPSLEVLLQSFVGDHPLTTSSVRESDKQPEEIQKELPL